MSARPVGRGWTTGSLRPVESPYGIEARARVVAEPTKRAGRTPFAEMVGHQLRKGFGTAKNPAAADAWYLLSLDALDDQQAPAVLPSQQDKRTAILRAALGAKGGQMADGGDGSRVPVVNNPEANLRIIWGE